MFWEYTPASTLTLQPSSLPTSVQPFVNPRLLQRIMWVFPKVRDLNFGYWMKYLQYLYNIFFQVIAFLLVAGLLTTVNIVEFN